VTFVERDQMLAAQVELSGPVSNPLIVKLQVAGGAKGRIVDEHGDAIPNLTLQQWLPSGPPGEMMQQAYNPSPLPPGDSKSGFKTLLSDTEGRFELIGLVPDQEYRIRVISHGKTGPGMMRGPLDVVIKVKAGQMLDVGNVQITNEKAFVEKYKLSAKAGD